MNELARDVALQDIIEYKRSLTRNTKPRQPKICFNGSFAIAIKKVLREVRVVLNLTHAEAATIYSKKFNKKYPTSNLIAFERNDRFPEMDHLICWCKVYDLTLSQFFTLVEEELC